LSTETGVKSQWDTEPTTLQKDVHVARTLLRQDRLQDVPVRVIHVTQDNVYLTAVRQIANLHTMEPIEPALMHSQDSMKIRSNKELAEDEIPEFIKKLLVNDHPSVPHETVVKLKMLLLKYLDVFHTTTLAKHKIDTGGTPPFRQPLRRFPPAHVQAIAEHVDNRIICYVKE